MVGVMLWDSNDAAHWNSTVFKGSMRVVLAAKLALPLDDDWYSVMRFTLSFIALYCSSKCIVFHGLVLGNPTFPLHIGTDRPYMKGATQ